MRIIFMGTPEFAVPTLEGLIRSGYEVCLVVTQPDKPKGRGHKILPGPVKEIALKYGIDIFQPDKVKNKRFTDTLRSYNADLIVTAAYGRLLTKQALECARLGCINVHASLLPKYRGAAPLWRVLINGENKTGVTIMYTDEGMDTGDMIDVAEFDIPEDMTVGQLNNELSELGAKTLLKTLDKLKTGKAGRIKQNDDEATYAPPIDKSEGLIKWEASAEQIHNLVRGTNPWPVAYTFFNEERMKIFRTIVVDSNKFNEAKPGTILDVDDNGILVKTGNGSILIKELQFNSSKKMDVKDYIRGHVVEKGDILRQSAE